MPKRRTISTNYKVLQRAGVMVEVEQLSTEELAAIDALSGEEVKALLNAFAKTSQSSKDKHGFWRTLRS
jgi:hypothetical protein